MSVAAAALMEVSTSATVYVVFEITHACRVYAYVLPPAYVPRCVHVFACVCVCMHLFVCVCELFCERECVDECACVHVWFLFVHACIHITVHGTITA